MHLQLQLQRCQTFAHQQAIPACGRQAHAARAAASPGQQRSAQICASSALAEPLVASAEAAELPETAAPQQGLEIQVKREDLDGGRVRLSITVPQRTVSHYWEQAVTERQEKKKPSLPPKKQARKNRIVGREEIKGALVERLGDLAMREAWTAAGLAERLVEDSIEYGEVNEFDPSADFSFSVEADVVPEVRWKQPYRSLQVKLVDPQPGDVPRMVEQQLQEQLRKTGSLQVVQGRGFQQGDTAVVDFSAKNAAGQDVPGLSRPRMRIDSSEPEQLPGLIAGIAGLQPGQQRDFNVPEPAGSHGHVSGELTCHVSMSELLVTEVPELDDEWVATNFPSVSGVQDLREQLTQGTQIAHVEQADSINERAMTEAIAAAVEVDIPQNLIVDNARRRFEEQLRNLAEKVPPEQMKQIATEQAFAAYVKQKQPELEATLRAVFGLADIAVKEHLTVDQEEVEQAVQKARSEGMQDSEELRDNVGQALADRLALAWMAENAQCTRVPMEF